MACSTSLGREFPVSNNVIEFNETELTEDDGMIQKEDGSYQLTLLVKIEPILSVRYKETENANPSLATDADIEYTDDGFSFTLSSPEALNYDTAGRTFLNWKNGEEIYEAGTEVTKGLEELDRKNHSRYEVIFTGNWEEASDPITDITGPGTYNLVAGTEYTLSFGPCTVNGDGCTYSSGITFYVPSDGAYTFANA